MPLPAAAVPVLPRRKQYFNAALAGQSAFGCQAPLCVEAGLLDGGALAVESNPAVLLVVAALERWLAGAKKAAAITMG